MTAHGFQSPAMAAYRIHAELFGDDGENYLTFSQNVEAYLVNGYVVSTPEMFILARPVPREAATDDILNPLTPFPLEDCNAWFVALMAGDPALCWTYYPLDLKYVGYQRAADSSIRWFDNNRYRRIIRNGIVTKTTESKSADPSTNGDESRRERVSAYGTA